jgi:hypothetical protein
VLDHDDNRIVDNGKEMFSDVAAQSGPPAGQVRSGFRALAMYDKAVHGGNSDGIIDNHDSVFPRLQLWQDQNHNGKSENQELHYLSQFGIESISLDYKESRRTDQYGNTFRYRAKITGTRRSDLGHWAYDVFLLSEDRYRGQPSILEKQKTSARLLASISQFMEVRPLRWRRDDIDYELPEKSAKSF